ncbi:MAG: PEP-CTERM sorting domain-containing protein [Candidatus Auribacter fodinae]|jgi:hypothetical protein|uniref:PEP-CTERM sorting domain-containing protein n=1 Tax=Candidatus Auribacter fodinae TaxID=2093366 RepID=A0A3A4R767_9BACT|nr:MAG: PEP-CTERM sorting domain-containing protein [Candidatus Auribacter fodinae]
MKRLTATLIFFSIVCLGYTGAHAFSYFMEDFESYTAGTDIADVSVPWSVPGEEQAGNIFGGNGHHFIIDDGGNNIAQIRSWGLAELSAPSTFAFGLIKVPLATSIDISGGGVFSFSIKTNYAASYASVLTPEVIDSNNNASRLADSELLTLPSLTDGWMTFNVSLYDMTAGSADFTDIRQFNILILETVNTNFDDGDGLVGIDNINVFVPEPSSMILLGSAVLGLIRILKRR